MVARDRARQIHPSSLTYVRSLGEGSFAAVDLYLLDAYALEPSIAGSSSRKGRRATTEGALSMSSMSITPAAPDDVVSFRRRLSTAPTGAGSEGERMVAVKRLKRNALDVALALFAHETSLHASMRHDNLVEFLGETTILEPGSTRASPAIVLEFMPGGSLAERLQKGDYSVEDALRWMLDLALGMAYVHQLGIAHRDLKPANVLLTEAGAAKLCDLGLSRSDRGEDELSAIASGKTGSAAYMSPEVWNGESRASSLPLSDAFSFAIVAFEMLSGQRAYESTFLLPEQIARSVAEKGLRPTMATHWPGALRSLLERCWAVDPTARPGFAQISTELRALLESARSDPAAFAGVSGGWRNRSLSTSVSRKLSAAKEMFAAILPARRGRPPGLGRRLDTAP